MRDVDWDSPSKEDIEWVNRFGTRAMRARLQQSGQRKAAVATAVQESDGEPDPEPTDDYDSMKAAELKPIAEERGIDLKAEGITNRTALIQRLRQWDVEQEEE